MGECRIIDIEQEISVIASKVLAVTDLVNTDKSSFVT